LSEADHGDGVIAVTAGYSEVAMCSIGPKVISFSQIGVTGRPQNWSVGTISHGEVCTMARRAVVLRRARGHGELGQGMGFALIYLHDEVRRIKAKLDGLVSTREAAGVSRDGHGTATARAHGRTSIAR